VLIRVYGAAVKGLAALASTLVLGQDITVAEWIERLNTPTVKIFFFVIVGLFTLSYVLKAVEWAIFVKKV